MPKKRVLLVDDNSAVCSLVRQLFELEPDFEIAGEAENGRNAVEKAESHKLRIRCSFQVISSQSEWAKKDAIRWVLKLMEFHTALL